MTLTKFLTATAQLTFIIGEKVDDAIYEIGRVCFSHHVPSTYLSIQPQSVSRSQGVRFSKHSIYQSEVEFAILSLGDLKRERKERLKEGEI